MIAGSRLRRRQGWLVTFLRDTRARWVYADLHEPWPETALHARGLSIGAPTTRWPMPASLLPQAPPRVRAEWLFRNALCHQVELLLDLRARLGLLNEGGRWVPDTLTVLAAQAEAWELARRFFELRLADDQAVPPALDLALSDALTATSHPAADQPLLGLPVHRLLELADARSVVALGRLVFSSSGRLDERGARAITSAGLIERVHLVEAVQALNEADGVVTAVESRVLERVIELARLEPEARALLATDAAEGLGVSELASRITDPLTRRLLLRQLSLQAHLDGAPAPEEVALLDGLAAAFGVSVEARMADAIEAIDTLAARPDLVSAFRLGALLRGYREHIGDRVSATWAAHADRLATEIRETRELVGLLRKWSRGPLSEAEEARARAQLLDICKTIPALAVLAAPGGVVLLPVLMRLLPFDLRPSAYVESDHALKGEAETTDPVTE